MATDVRMSANVRRGAAAGLLGAAFAVCAPAQDYDPSDDLRVFRQRHSDVYKQLKSERNRLSGELRRREAAGEPVAYAKQVLHEAKWLISYTAEYDRAAERLADLRRSLEAGAAQAVEQAEDGSYAPGCQEWFFRLDLSLDRLILLNALGQKPPRPLTLLERVNSPERLAAYFDSILISDIPATGRDHRKELNFSAAALARLIPGAVESGFSFHPELEQALWRYLDDRWQDPQTGYWGAWYRKDGRVIKTADLSITFHIVSYRAGRVRRWPQIIATTLAIRERDYPFGWLENGRRSNHHHYDVVTLLRHGWPHMTEAQRAESRTRIDEMLAWCLAETIRPDGTFDGDASDGTPEAFYFGVSFLDEIGCFDAQRRFWTDRELPEAEALRQRLLRAVMRLNMTDEHTLFAFGKLTR